MAFGKGTRMRATWVGLFATGFGLAGTLTASGCIFVYYEDDCELAYDCPTAGTGGMSSSSTSGTGGTGGTPASCIPSESKDPVADSCGVFVSSSLGLDGLEADRGTQAKPFKSISAALTKAGAARVYACAESFTEAVTISAAVELYGGLDCKSWKYVGAAKKTTLTAKAGDVPLELAGDATIEDFAIAAADATVDGGSSIAVIATQVTASFARCDLAAGAGKAALAGMTPTDPVGPTDSNDVAIKGNDGRNACMDPSAQLGGDAKENALCPAASGGPIGGAGGQGATLKGGNGDSIPPDAKTALARIIHERAPVLRVGVAERAEILGI